MFLNDEYYMMLRNKPTIIDLGSEVGISTTYFKLMYPNSTILAFEPDPTSYRLLRTNIKQNNMKNVRAFNIAVSNKNATLPFYIDPQVDGSLTMSLYPTRQQKKVLVKVKKLSLFITKNVDLIKMDIEGAELLVLQDLSKSKKMRYINSMIVEYHHHIKEKIDNLSVFLDLLEKEGFGYQVRAKYPLPFKKEGYQDFLIFAYRK
jgi:FkbM family methyltransferase